MSEYNSSDQSEAEFSATPCPPISQNGDIEYVGRTRRQRLIRLCGGPASALSSQPSINSHSIRLRALRCQLNANESFPRLKGRLHRRGTLFLRGSLKLASA